MAKLPEEYSFSELSTLAMCPRKAFYRYIMGLKETNDAMVFGRAVHKGQEYDNRARVAGESVTQAQVLERAVETFKVECKDNSAPQIGLSPVDDFAKQHVKQLEVYWSAEDGRNAVHPVKGTIEAPFEIDVKTGEQPATVSGFLDLVSQAEEVFPGEVVDYKAVGRPVGQAEAEENLQMQLYMKGAKTNRARVVSFVKYAKQKPTAKVVVTKPRTNFSRLFMFLADTIQSFRHCLKSGFWPKCSPTAFWCSQKSCAFFSRCYPNKVESKLITIEEIRPVGSLEMPDWR